MFSYFLKPWEQGRTELLNLTEDYAKMVQNPFNFIQNHLKAFMVNFCRFEG